MNRAYISKLNIKDEFMTEALQISNPNQDDIKNLPILLKDTNYKLTQFTQDKIDQFEERIYIKDVRGKPTLYTECIVRKKEIKLTPEEAVRQLYLMILTDDMGYPTDRMEIEYSVTFGREKKRADIVIQGSNP